MPYDSMKHEIPRCSRHRTEAARNDNPQVPASVILYGSPECLDVGGSEVEESRHVPESKPRADLRVPFRFPLAFSLPTR